MNRHRSYSGNSAATGLSGTTIANNINAVTNEFSLLLRTPQVAKLGCWRVFDIHGPRTPKAPLPAAGAKILGVFDHLSKKKRQRRPEGAKTPKMFAPAAGWGGIGGARLPIRDARCCPLFMPQAAPRRRLSGGPLRCTLANKQQ